jgi:hypothetical protein
MLSLPFVLSSILDMVVPALVIAHHVHVMAWEAGTVGGVGDLSGKTSFHN